MVKIAERPFGLVTFAAGVRIWAFARSAHLVVIDNSMSIVSSFTWSSGYGNFRAGSNDAAGNAYFGSISGQQPVIVKIVEATLTIAWEKQLTHSYPSHNIDPDYTQELSGTYVMAARKYLTSSNGWTFDDDLDYYLFRITTSPSPTLTHAFNIGSITTVNKLISGIAVIPSDDAVALAHY